MTDDMSLETDIITTIEEQLNKFLLDIKEKKDCLENVKINP
jgi:hypothetical protein